MGTFDSLSLSVNYIGILQCGFLFFILSLTWIIQYQNVQNGKKKKWLPGPPHIPLLGSVPFLCRYLGMPNYEAAKRLCEKYGSIIGYYLGFQYFVVVQDYEIAKYILASDDWSNRGNDHPMHYERSFNQQIGLVIGNGEGWKEIRKFTIKSLRKFGFGRGNSMEGALSFELDEILEQMKKGVDENGGKGVMTLHQFFNISALNILWSMMAGVRFSRNDDQLNKLMELIDKTSQMSQLGSTPMYAFPFLRKIPHLTEHDMQLHMHYECQNIFRDILESRRAQGRYLDDPSDFIDIFLHEIETRKTKANIGMNKFYTDEQFIMVGVDLFLTGADSTSTSLEFGLLYMILNEEVQKKVQEEIDEVVGKYRLPTLADKPMMPYTEATTLEIFRYSSLLPLTVRCPVKDTEINGCFVPKGSLVGVNLHMIHFSPELWEDPNVFRPERFLDDNNNLINTSKVMPFGFGKRVCMGEALGRATFFIFFTTLLQKYKFKRSPLHPQPSTVPISGFTQYPKSYYSLIESRHKET